MNTSLAFMMDESTARKRGPVRPPLKTAKTGNLAASPGPDLIAVSARMQDIAAFVWRLALSEVPIILIEGEQGTGRETVARAIHYQSPRRDIPVIVVDCTVSPEDILEKELDAGGMVLLNDIDALPLHLQGKILSWMGQQHLFRFVATARNRLQDAVRTGSFCLDLFYHLSTIRIEIPPLRNRRDDILPLAHHFLRRRRDQLRSNVDRLSPAAADLLLAHDWPGNIAELRDVVERAVNLASTGVIEASSLGIDPHHESGT